MDYNNTTFIFLFLPMLIILYYNPIIKGLTFKNVILVLASLFFYACGNPEYVFLLLFELMINYLCGTYIGRNSDKEKTKKIILAVSIVMNLGILFFFKFKVLPLGISYYTFSSISYLLDTYWYESSDRRNVTFLDVALYICAFYKIMTGPIVQFNEHIIEIQNREASFDDVCIGLERFAKGFIKKVMIADSLSNLVASCFSNSDLSFCMAWLGAISFALQLYFDFSGYTDMAIGIGQLFGFHLPENFNFPYISKSVSEFWRRWHISLTKWFTRYLYIPLGGNRVKTPLRHIFNLLVVWLFTGIWHGSNWTFLVWGLGYFLIQVLEKYTLLRKVAQIKILNHFYTMFVVIILWVVFRSDSLSSAGRYLLQMFGVGAGSFADKRVLQEIKYHLIPLLSGIILCLPIKDWFKSKMKKLTFIETIVSICIIILFCMSLCMIFGTNYSAALYAGF